MSYHSSYVRFEGKSRHKANVRYWALADISECLTWSDFKPLSMDAMRADRTFPRSKL